MGGGYPPPEKKFCTLHFLLQIGCAGAKAGEHTQQQSAAELRLPDSQRGIFRAGAERTILAEM